MYIYDTLKRTECIGYTRLCKEKNLIKKYKKVNARVCVVHNVYKNVGHCCY